MTAEHLALLETSIDRTLEFEMLDGTRFLATPLFVYTGEDNPDVFLLPVQRQPQGHLVVGMVGQSILLQDIASVRHVPPA